VSKKIVDLLGMEEDDLVKYVLQFIRERKGPDELVSELEGVRLIKLYAYGSLIYVSIVGLR
jgi:hypothetical protein